jgi:choline dehydrogenase-like flavoprotein
MSLGTDGPVVISYPKELSPSHELWHATLANLNVQTNKAPLSGSSVGAWTTLTAVDPKTASRSYAASAYYLPNAHRPNLWLCTDANVTEVLMDDKHGDSEWATKGVRFLHKNKQYTALASEEVIVCAGSIASPQLLELSGIGDPSILKEAGIAVKVENHNVGEHLQDHIMTATIYEIDPSVPTPDNLRRDPVAAAMADHIYETTRGGPRTILPGSYCYLPLSHFVEPQRLASLAGKMSTATAHDVARKRRVEQAQRLGQIEFIFDVGNWSTSKPEDPDDKKAYATLLQILQYPFSIGSIHIDRHDPAGKPIIDPQYYAGRQGALDLEIQELCAEFGRSITATPPLRDFIKKRVWPPEDVHGTKLRDWIAQTTVTDWHPVGTCSMGGREGKKMGVVDERLRVYGVKGLRVVDASIMPLQISAHLQATVYAIAEKASDMIKEDRGGR